MIVDVGIHSDLEWKLSGEEFFLSFAFAPLDPFDLVKFNCYRLAMEEFAVQAPSSAKVIFGEIGTDFTHLFQKTDRLEERFAEREHNHFNLFCADLYSEYLHRLASQLPDEMEACIQMQGTKKLDAEGEFLFCKRRFEHFHLLGLEKEARVGIVLPQDALFEPSAFDQILSEQKEPYHCIPEELLNEYWDGLDELVVVENQLSEIGKRMLLGFEAAGGKVRGR